MTLDRRVRTCETLLSGVFPSVFLAVVLAASVAWGGPAANVVIWDTQSRPGYAVDIRDRTGWQVVPTDPFTLEADPAKAFSDPGYYGREYAFAGDAVVENGCLTAVFHSAQGRIVVYSKADPGAKAMELSLLQGQNEPDGMVRCAILRNTDAEAALEVFFNGGASAVVTFDHTEIIAIRPVANVKGLRLRGPIDYGVAPDFIGDDLVVSPSQYPSANTLNVPIENLFLGLLAGENRMLVMTWPEGRQQMRLELGDAGQGTRRIESIDFDNDGQCVYLALLEAPGIWHREPLTASFLEKDVALGWRRPFAARWITQLEEAGLKTTFPFRTEKGQIWRGAAGMYTYPIWFEGDKACYRLSKKVMPRGESVVYFLEGQEAGTPVRSPVDILKSTLGRQACDTILDLPGRKLRTHHRRGAEGIRRACTCGCTEAIEAVFKADQEVERKDYVEEAVGDMVYFVARHVERIDEYRVFAEGLTKFLRGKGGSSPELKPYLDLLEQIAAQIPAQYEVQKQNIKSLEYADELARKTIALTTQKNAKNLPTCLELGKDWRGMGGAQDGLLAEYHMIVRRLFQEAGSGCLTQPAAVELAKEIRGRCRQCLRNPDGYEIWADY